MNSYYKAIADGFIVTIGVGDSGVEISKAEYNELMQMIRNKPAKTGTTDYKLSENLEWVPYETEAPDEDADIDPDEALSIIMGGN